SAMARAGFVRCSAPGLDSFGRAAAWIEWQELLPEPGPPLAAWPELRVFWPRPSARRHRRVWRPALPWIPEMPPAEEAAPPCLSPDHWTQPRPVDPVPPLLLSGWGQARRPVFLVA